MNKTLFALCAVMLTAACDPEGVEDEVEREAMVPGQAPDLEPFNVLPEDADEGSYWISTVEVDEDGVPHLVRAVELTEDEMLADAAEMQRLYEEGAEPKVWGQVSCGSISVSPLVMYSGNNFTGNRICFENTTSTRAWFYYGNWYWGSTQISGNVGAVADYNEFQFQTWTDYTVETNPVGFPTPITWPSTQACWTNTDDDGFGVTQIGNTGFGCHRFASWIWLGTLPAQF